MQKKNVRAILLIISTLTYLLIGAAVFEKLEHRADLEKRHEISMIAQKLYDKYNFSKEDSDVLQVVVIKSISHKGGIQWGFAGAFYFAVIVITTLGYGHSTPYTMLGKLFCMVFALVGIPLGLIMFQSIGERINTAIAYILKKLRSSLNSYGYTVLREISPKHLLFVSFSVGMAVIIIGAYVFHKFEKWSLFEAYYYCFISLSTIGFGDYVPLQKDGLLNMHPGYFAFTLIFIFSGLALFSASVNLLVLGFMAPNANSTSAKNVEPLHAIVFETFSPPLSLKNRWSNLSNSISRIYLYPNSKIDGSYNDGIYPVESMETISDSTIYCDDYLTSNGAVVASSPKLA